jgi:outer membrane protein
MRIPVDTIHSFMSQGLIRAVVVTVLLLSAAGMATAADVKVAVVDVARLQQEVPQIGKLRARISAAFASRERTLADQQEQIERLEAKLAEDQERMSITEGKSLQRDIRSRKLRLENAREELESDRRLRLNEEMDRLRRILAEVIAEVAKAEDLDIVLESGVTWASQRANITDKVLARMRELDAASE